MRLPSPPRPNIVADAFLCSQAYAKKREKKEKAEAAKLEKQLHDLLAKGQTDASAAIEAGRKKSCVRSQRVLIID